MRAILLAVFLLLVPASADAQSGQRKAALIIANGAYAATTQLANPASDGRLVAAAARKAGFDVTLVGDLSNAAFQRALRDFRTKSDGAQVAMVYYAGHGIEGAGKNWLIPVDAELKSDLDLPYEAMDLDRVMESISGAQVRMVVLDACRNNPFGRSWRSSTRAVQRGLAGMEVDDVLVIYAAAPGQTASDGDGANSPFATSLARRLIEPDLPIQLLGGAVRDDVLSATGGSQRPFVSASITGTPIYLVPRAGPGQPYAAVAPPTTDRATLDALTWQGALGAQSVAAFEEYKLQFPNGRFVKLADQNIARLGTVTSQPVSAAPTSATEPTAIVRGYLGLQVQPLSDDVAASLGLPASRGELVQGVEPGQGAATAGLASGDVVVRVDGKEVSPDQTLPFIVANTAPGKRITIEVFRGGRRLAVDALVGTRPSEADLARRETANAAQQPAVAASATVDAPIGDGVIQRALGFAVVGMTPQFAMELGRPDSVGVAITGVDKASDAGAKGLARGDVILSANNAAVANPQELEAALRAAQGSGRSALLLSVSRGSRPPVFLAVKLRQ